MLPLRILSASEQVAAHLREAILQGAWGDVMPGIQVIAAQLAVNHKTVKSALSKLEQEGLLVGQGPRKPRRIRVSTGQKIAHRMRIALMHFESSDRKLDYVAKLTHMLEEAGHAVSSAPKTMADVRFDLERITRLVGATEADAWVVFSGSREILEWFAAQPTPVLALFGRRNRVPIASVGPDKSSAYRSVVRRLVELGHRRIVLLSRHGRRKPTPGLLERSFLNELEILGIPTGPYNLPDWEDDKLGFIHCLDLLLQPTPPTALLIDEAPLFTAAQQHLARQGILAPENISLVCTDHNSTFDWCEPSIAHISWDDRPVIQRIVHWANNISRGKEDQRKVFTKSEFIPGGTIGRVEGGGETYLAGRAPGL